MNELKVLPEIRSLLFPLREEELRLKETKRRFVGAEVNKEAYGVTKVRLINGE
jgi:hypothetical protein